MRYVKDTFGNVYEVLEVRYGGSVRIQHVISKSVYTVALHEVQPLTQAELEELTR